MMFLMFVLVLILLDKKDEKKSKVVREATKEQKQVDSSFYEKVIGDQKEEINRLQKVIILNKWG